MHENRYFSRCSEFVGTACLTIIGGLAVVGCGSSPTSDGGQLGGSTASGGSAQAGGSSSGAGGASSGIGGNANGSGGTTAADPTGGGTGAGGSSADTGGRSSDATGGKAAGGATAATGGKAGGGATATGGKSAGATGGNANAGSSATGGKANGGSSATGGKSGGGASATGGKSSGGGTATGGKSSLATGGKSGGGASATGGNSATTGGVSATGGSGSGVCSFTVDTQLASALKSNSPGTVAVVKWSVSGGGAVSAARIEFGLDTNYGMTAPVDLTADDYQTPLLGMKPSKTYHYRIVATAGSSTCTSEDYTIQTGPKASSVSISGFTVSNENARKRGFIVTSYWQGSGSAVPFIIDADGEIVWWSAGGPSAGISRARMSADGKNMWMVVPSLNGGPVQRVTMDTLEAQTYSSTSASHDITPVSGALMAYLDYGVTCDGITEIDPSGTTNRVFGAQGVVPSSGCHSNALRYSQAEDVYTYSDLQSDVYVISRTGSVQWRLSERVSGGNSAWGGKQHGHHLTDDSILIFANNGGGNNASTVIEYTLQGQLIKEFTSGGFTANLGDVQRLPGGNTLVTYSNGRLIQELDAQGNVVLEIKSASSSFGYAEWRDSLYGPPVDIVE